MRTTCRLASWLALAAIWAHHLGGAAGVRIRDLDVPAVALQDDDVHLRCDYEDEGGSALYTLKWYKDGREFYRHQPGISSHAALHDRCLDHHTYHVDGVNVDCWVSTEREVVLRGVSRTTSGDYQCEVIGEHPKFRKEVRKARLTVFSEALQRPVVAGARAAYRPLDHVRLNCSSANSQYLPLLSWRLNGRPAPSTFLLKDSNRRTLGLSFQARADLFHRGVIRAACVTSLGSHHSRSPEVILRDPDYLSAQQYNYNAGGRWRAGWMLPCLACLAHLLLLLLLAHAY